MQPTSQGSYGYEESQGGGGSSEPAAAPLAHQAYLSRPLPSVPPTHSGPTVPEPTASSSTHIDPSMQRHPQQVRAFALPILPGARESASSLMDAVFGPDAPRDRVNSGQGFAQGQGLGHGQAQGPATQRVSASAYQSAVPAASASQAAHLGSGSGSGSAPMPSAYRPIRKKSQGRDRDVRRTPSTRSATNTETDSWDKLSDADSRLDEEAGGKREEVEELERNVNKRKSVLPHLESELAALNERIRAAEDRLARVQRAQGSENAAPGTQV